MNNNSCGTTWINSTGRYTCCGHSTKAGLDDCEDIQRKYEELGISYMCGSKLFPHIDESIKDNVRAPFHQEVLRLFHRILKIPYFDNDDKQHFLASHHWHPIVLKEYFGNDILFPKYISKSLGDQIGFNSDLSLKITIGRVSPNKRYYVNVPSVSMTQARDLLLIMISENQINSVTPIAKSIKVVNDSSINDNMRSIVNMKKTFQEKQYEEEEFNKNIKEKHKKVNLQVNLLSSMTQEQKDFYDKKEKTWNKERQSLEAKITLLNSENQSKSSEINSISEASLIGLSRFNITNPDWYILPCNKNAAADLFGFKCFKQMKIYIECFFPGDLENFKIGAKGDDPITSFEKCLITLMRFHRRFSYKCLGFIWGRDGSNIGRYVKLWSPKWGKVGEMLSQLRITPAFLENSRPNEFNVPGMRMVGALVDGKAFGTDSCRTNSAIKRSMYNDKIKHEAVLIHVWITPIGLIFDSTDAYLGRLTEGALVSLQGKGSLRVTFNNNNDYLEII